jgi:exosortase/archaeosortase
MTVLRRLLLLAAFAYWQGGFTFYAAIVVPTGTEVLGSSAEQGKITRRVAATINLTGAIALAIFALDIVFEPRLRRSRAIAMLVAVILLVALMVLRDRLDVMFHGEDAFLDDRAEFRPWHRTYLWLSTAQWATCVVYLILTLAAWRNEDRAASPIPPRSPSVS